MEHLSTFLNILHALTQKLETEEEKKNRKKYRRGWGNFKVQKNAWNMSKTEYFLWNLMPIGNEFPTFRLRCVDRVHEKLKLHKDPRYLQRLLL